MGKKVLFFLLIIFISTLLYTCNKKDKRDTLFKTKAEETNVELTSIPTSWNGVYALKFYPSVKILEIKDGKIFQLIGEEKSEIFPGKALSNGYKVKITETECSAYIETNSFKYVKNNDGSIDFSMSGTADGIIEYIKL